MTINISVSAGVGARGLVALVRKYGEDERSLVEPGTSRSFTVCEGDVFSLSEERVQERHDLGGDMSQSARATDASLDPLSGGIGTAIIGHESDRGSEEGEVTASASSAVNGLTSSGEAETFGGGGASGDFTTDNSPSYDTSTSGDSGSSYDSGGSSDSGSSYDSGGSSDSGSSGSFD